MNRILWFSIIAIIVLLLDWYAYFGLKVAISNLTPNLQRIFRWIFWGLSTITILTFLLFQPLSEHQKTRGILMIMMTIGFANILGKLLFGIWIFLADVVRLV